MDMAKAAEGPGELWAGSWSLSSLFAGPGQHPRRGGWSSPGPLRALPLPRWKPSPQPWGICSRQGHNCPSLPLLGQLPQRRGTEPGPVRTHSSPALPFPHQGHPLQPLPGSGTCLPRREPRRTAQYPRALSLLGRIPLCCAALARAVPALPSSRDGSSSLSRAQAQRLSNYLLCLCLCLAWPPFLQQRLPVSHCFLWETPPSAQPLLPSLEKGRGTAGSGGTVPHVERASSGGNSWQRHG